MNYYKIKYTIDTNGKVQYQYDMKSINMTNDVSSFFYDVRNNELYIQTDLTLEQDEINVITIDEMTFNDTQSQLDTEGVE